MREGSFMKIFKSFSLIATFALVIGSIFGVVKGLSMSWFRGANKCKRIL